MLQNLCAAEESGDAMVCFPRSEEIIGMNVPQQGEKAEFSVFF